MLNSRDKVTCTLISGLVNFLTFRAKAQGCLMMTVLTAGNSEPDFPFYQKGEALHLPTL